MSVGFGVGDVVEELVDISGGNREVAARVGGVILRIVDVVLGRMRAAAAPLDSAARNVEASDSGEPMQLYRLALCGGMAAAQLEAALRREDEALERLRRAVRRLEDGEEAGDDR